MSKLYLDPQQPVDVRVADLLQRMTLEEKIQQMGAVWNHFTSSEPDVIAQQCAEKISLGIGQVARAMQDAEPIEHVRGVNGAQRYLREQTRLGIPAIYHVEALAGVVMRQATQFPQAIGYASTWNPALLQRTATIIGDQMELLGLQHVLSPLLDINRDARNGRTEEMYGEDHLLVAAMGCAFISGLQEKEGRLRLIATGKHFAGYGFVEGGHNSGSFRCGPREFHDEFLYPFEAAVKTANLQSIMNAYHEIDGVPCVANRELLTDILRGEWGFTGTVVSDYGSLPQLFNDSHRIANDAKEASALAVNAGMDIENLEFEAFYALKDAVESGLVAEATIDTAVTRILRHKFLLGLFEDPYVDEAQATPAALDSAESRRLAFEGACESIVLLKNAEDVLPLREARTIAVVGPAADLPKALLGDYCYGIHPELPGTPLVTVLAGIRERAEGNAEVVYAEGCTHDEMTDESLQAALAVAKQADVVVAVMGELAHVHTGEPADRDSVFLPGRQEEFLAELATTGKPIVLVLLNGRPISTMNIDEHCAAILEAWFPGEEGGNAVAAVLFGDVNPAGRLPVSVPKHAAQVPVHYNRRRTSMLGSYGKAGLARPLYPFGYGLSYTSFVYANFAISAPQVDAGGTVEISVDVENTGTRSGAEVVQLYIQDIVGSTSRPLKELKGFCKLMLAAGEQQTVRFTLPTELLAFHGLDMQLSIEPGTINVMVGSSSEDIRCQGEFQITGARKILPSRRVFFSEVAVSAKQSPVG